MDVDDARWLASELLQDALPQRWRHVQAVADQAEELARRIDLDRLALVCAAWLHDIGYSPNVPGVGFHPLDGARHLRSAGWPDDVCALVAHHSCARMEAERRGLAEMLRSEFTDQPTPERDALWAADATTGPDGQRFSLEERVAEVVERYGPGDVVSDCMRAIQPDLAVAIARTRGRLASAVG
jgi:putative nucleotidyltransferase with HDIG domain